MFKNVVSGTDSIIAGFLSLRYNEVILTGMSSPVCAGRMLFFGCLYCSRSFMYRILYRNDRNKDDAFINNHSGKAVRFLAVCLTGMLCMAVFRLPALAEASGEITGRSAAVSYSPEDPGDNDALFEGYVEQVFLNEETPEPSGIHKMFRKAVRRLEGINARIAQLLKEHIQAVAAGEETSAVFGLTVGEIGIGELTWTAEDLGVDSIVEEVGGRLVISDAAAAAGAAKTGIDLRSITSTLLAECPYDLYWYDKTEGAEMGGLGFSAKNQDGEWMLFPYGTVSFGFAVSADYALEAEDGSLYLYEVNPETGAAVTAAAGQAGSIVDENAGLPDRQKLEAYREAICGLTAYNTAAANDPNRKYGNPWQLIWVFDGDVSTKVVCEGYAKAFQYLCNMSTFESDALNSRIVTGLMTGGIGAGGHMWNIVTMPDGLNYMVDVTNCDIGTSGYPDRLFLVRPDEENRENRLKTGYWFDTNGSSLHYAYSDDTKSLYDASELILTLRELTEESQEEAFAETDIVLPSDLTVIEEEALSGLPVSVVKCGEALQTIESRAFAGCTELSHIYIPESTETIAEDAFEGCEDPVIWGKTGSAAEAYAEEHELSFRVFEE